MFGIDNLMRLGSRKSRQLFCEVLLHGSNMIGLCLEFCGFPHLIDSLIHIFQCSNVEACWSKTHFHWQVFLKDTDERACAYIAGPAASRWGFTAEGRDLFYLINASNMDGTLCLLETLDKDCSFSFPWLPLSLIPMCIHLSSL